MWARVVECMLGVWMLISPFIFRHPADATARWANDLAIGCILIVFSLASYWRPTGWAHWLLIPVGAWMVTFGRLSGTPPLAPALQNEIVVGLLLMMFAIVPNNAAVPHARWQEALHEVESQ